MLSSQDIFSTYKNRSEKWIAKSFPVFHSFILSTSALNISWREKLWLYHHKTSNPPTCKCGNSLKFIDIVKGYRKYCSVKCKANDASLLELVKQRNLEKWGYTNPMKCPTIKQKLNQTIQTKYGVDNISKLPETKLKVRSSNLKNFGTEYVSQLSSVKKILSDSMKIKSKELNQLNMLSLKRRIENKVSKLGIRFIRIVKTSIYEFECSKNHIFQITKNSLNDRIRNNNKVCTFCNPINAGSDAQMELFEFIKKLYVGKIIKNYRKVGKEIDIFLPDLNIGFEYNGLFWHSSEFKDKYYHLNKFELCNSKHIKLFHIWEDDWIFKKEDTKRKISQLLNSFNPNESSNVSFRIGEDSISILRFNGDISKIIENLSSIFKIHKFYYLTTCTVELELISRCGFKVTHKTEPLFEFFSKNKRIELQSITYRPSIFEPSKITGFWNIGLFKLSYFLN